MKNIRKLFLVLICGISLVKATDSEFVFFDANIEKIQLLLDSGGNIDQQDKYGNTALIYAAVCHNVGIVKLLLEKGANINHQNKEGETALMCAACQEGDIEIISLLLAHGADIKLENKSGDTVFAYAKGEYDMYCNWEGDWRDIVPFDKKNIIALLKSYRA